MATTASDEEPQDVRLVITASALGTVFEWYDFFIYGTLVASDIIGRTFFPAASPTAQTLAAWAVFAVGFGFRPLGAVLFGYLGDRLGRKYTFLITITLMGLATAGVGLIPSADSIGVAAPVLVVLLRIVQGLALGGEYGGAAIYVAEHSPPGRAGYYTSFIQAGVSGGFVLSLLVVLATRWAEGPEVWAAGGWRAPFLFSLLLLVISLWTRFKLHESPVFERMRAAGERVANPFVASFTYPGNLRRLFVALFGIAAGLTVIWYTATFSVLSFLQGTMRMDPVAAQLTMAVGGGIGLGWFVLFGRASDRFSRKWPIVIGYVGTLLLLFPIFWTIGRAANPDLVEASASAPVIVSGPSCAYDPFAKKQADECGQLLDYFSKKGVAYTKAETPAVSVSIAGDRVGDLRPSGLDAALARAGYRLDPVTPGASGIIAILLCVVLIAALSGITYGPVAALLSEMFPPEIRYSSMSIPYHIGTGYFGGFLPFISQYIVARTGDPYAGLWYCWGVVAMSLAVTLFGLKPQDEAPRR